MISRLLKIFRKQKPIEIECAISTPQFRGTYCDYWKKKQTGKFNTKTFLFTPDDNPKNDKGEIGKHCVQFESIEHFKQFKIKP